MKLILDTSAALWKEYGSYKRVVQYMNQWIVEYDNFGNSNFRIITKGDSQDIDLDQTLSFIDDETLLKIAIDIGVNTPDFIPVVQEISNILKVNYNTALVTFKKAFEESYENPDIAIGLANSALESICKHILNDKLFGNLNRKKTLYDLTQDILKQFKLYPTEDSSIPKEISNIASGLLNISQNIEKIRSDKTKSHGKLEDEYIVKDNLYAFFVINSVSTIGLFLIGYYEGKYNKEKTIPKETFDLDNLPF